MKLVEINRGLPGLVTTNWGWSELIEVNWDWLRLIEVNWSWSWSANRSFHNRSKVLLF